MQTAADVLQSAPVIGTQGLMGLPPGEARSLKVSDVLSNGRLKVINGGGWTDTTKTRESMLCLPISETVAPWIVQLCAGKQKSSWLFESPRKEGTQVGKGYDNGLLTRARSDHQNQHPWAVPHLRLHHPV